MEEKIKQLEDENRILKNRCFLMTMGAMCIFCPFECEKRNGIFRGDSNETENI